MKHYAFLLVLAACSGTGSAVSVLSNDGGSDPPPPSSATGTTPTPLPPPPPDGPIGDPHPDATADVDAGVDAPVDAGPCPGFTEWDVPPNSCLFINTEFTATHLAIDEAGAPICSPSYPFGGVGSGVCIKTMQYPTVVWVSNTSVAGDRVLYMNANCPPADCP